MWIIHAMSMPYILKLHILKLKTNVKKCNSSMKTWNICQETELWPLHYVLTLYIDRNTKNNEKQVC
jgi:hypothetical protein